MGWKESNLNRHYDRTERSVEIFKDEKFAIVADDLAQESRQYRVDVPEDIEDPLYALAKWWQIFDGCALATDPKKVRG